MPNVSGLRYDRKDYDEGEKIIEWKLIGKEEKKKIDNPRSVPAKVRVGYFAATSCVVQL